MPVIHLDPPREQSGVHSAVRFFTAIDGIHRDGTVYRMDEVPVPIRRLVDSPLPSDEEVLKAISGTIRTQRMSARSSGGPEAGNVSSGPSW